jgi:hypothetical protein
MKKFFGVFICLMLGVGLLAAPNAGATAYDPTGYPGNVPQPPPTAMINNHGMLGDFLIGDFYRAVVNDQFFDGSNVATYISIENVSKYWVAAHVRLRSGRFSIEVLDFPILLSPYDVFWFQFQAIPKAGGGLDRVEIISTDKKTIEYSGLNTLSAIPGATVSYDPATGLLKMSLNNYILKSFNFDNPDYAQLNETTQGYVEVIGLFAIASTNGLNFYDLMKALWTDSVGNPLPGTTAPNYASLLKNDGSLVRYTALDVSKYLGGHVFVGDFQTGLYMGYTMKAIKDFRAGLGAHRDFCIRGQYNGTGKVLVNPATILYNYTDISSVDPAYTAPDWATDFGPTANDGDSQYASGGGVDTRAPGACSAWCSRTASFSLDEFDNALYKDSLYSTFFNTGFSGKTYSLISLLAPSKFLHWFYDDESGLGGLYSFTDDCWPVGSISQAYSLRAKLPIDNVYDGIGNICVETYGIWDLEEKTIRISSPGVPFRLPYELNFVPVGYESYVFLQDFCYLVAGDQSPFWFYASDAQAGRYKLDHFTYCDGYYGGDPRVTDPYYVTKNCGSYYCGTNADYLLPIGELPVLALGMDVEGTNYPHARLFEIQWDNPERSGLKLGYDGNGK